MRAWNKTKWKKDSNKALEYHKTQIMLRLFRNASPIVNVLRDTFRTGNHFKKPSSFIIFCIKNRPIFLSKLQRVKITWFLTVCSFWKSPQKSHWSHHTASVVKTASKCEFYNFWKIGIIFCLKLTWDILGDFQTLWSSFQPSMYLVTWRSNLSLLLSSHQSFQWLATLD